MSYELRVSSEYLYGKGIPGGVSLTFFVGKEEFNNLNSLINSIKKSITRLSIFK